MNVDFSRLYSDLGVHPDCSLDDFKLAYRRRIGELHPDRLPNTDIKPDLPAEELNALYAQAMRFCERYGRLPGSTASPANVERARKPVHGFSEQVSNSFNTDTHAALPSSVQNKHRRDWILIGLSIALVLLIAFAE